MQATPSQQKLRRRRLCSACYDRVECCGWWCRSVPSIAIKRGLASICAALPDNPDVRLASASLPFRARSTPSTSPAVLGLNRGPPSRDLSNGRDVRLVLRRSLTGPYQALRPEAFACAAGRGVLFPPTDPPSSGGRGSDPLVHDQGRRLTSDEVPNRNAKRGRPWFSRFP
jgi:hypothetical protein